jgi:DNA-binding transcriptional ArsR family regulator
MKQSQKELLSLRGVAQALVRQIDDLAHEIPDDVCRPTNAGQIRQAIRERHRRGSYFPEMLFREVGWDVLLELFATELEKRQISKTAIAAAIGAPHTTVLRWLAVLGEAGLIKEEPDRHDRRRAWVKLTTDGYRRMDGYFLALSTDDYAVRNNRVKAKNT